MKLSKLLVIAGLSAAAAGAQASTNLVTNGSFEADSMASGSWAIVNNLTGWTGLPEVEIRNNIAGVAQDGVNYVELDTAGNGGISQTITGSGLATLSFWYSARPFTGYTNDLMVSFGNLTATVLQGAYNMTTDHVWQQFTATVDMGTSGSATLSFYGAGVSDGFGGSLDNISVTAVPEPESYAMLLAGLGLIGTIARRRNKADAK